VVSRIKADFAEGHRTTEESESYFKRVGGKERWERLVDGYLRLTPEYRMFKHKEADMMTIGRSATSAVLWDAEFLCKRQEPFYRTLSITEKACGHQTVVLSERV
jgi:hypothetical protein